MRVKFALPVGALINGWRHLGNGEFVADTERPERFGRPPEIIEGTVAGPDDVIVAPVMVPFDDPLSDGGYRKVAFVSLPGR